MRPAIPTALRLLGLVLSLTVSTLTANAADTLQIYTKGVQPFLQKHCLECHGPDEQESGVRFDRLTKYQVADSTLWTKVHEAIASGEMPPEDHEQPSDTEKEQLLRWIVAKQTAFRGGTTRRLNRRELSSALKDLTGLSVNYADDLPADGTIDGFDTGAAGLQDAASSVAQIMDVTRRAVDGIRFLEPFDGQVFAADFSEVKDPRKAFDAWKEAGGRGKARRAQPGLGVLLEPKWVGEKGGMEMYLPPPKHGNGVLRLKIVVSVKKFFDGVPDPHLWVKIAGRTFDYGVVSNSPDHPEERIFEVQLNDLAVGSKGVGVTLSSKVELPYDIKGFENEVRSKPDEKVRGGLGLYRPKYDKKAPTEKQPVPFIVLHSIEIIPDYVASWPPVSWEGTTGDLVDDLPTAKRLLDLWINRAWRRPVKEAEQTRFIALYQRLREQKLSFDNALRATFHSVLLSGTCRYLPSPGDSDELIAQHALASRLSFMLHGGPPDEELRSLAAQNKLSQPEILDAQVDRLLDDPRSRAFFEPFVVQWLELEQPITLTMSDIKRQDFRFGRYLKESMREETITYVQQLIADNRPARELVDSNWTMMNDSLATHYRYRDVKGAQLRKVKLKKDDPRGGGVLAHAGIQSMLCWMGDNWVIYRGAWAMRHILDDPPPPPPLDVPELNPSEGENRGKPFREVLKQHQADSKCSVCHKSIDPLGFAMQNFDISGRWRDVEFERYTRNQLDGKIEWYGVGKTRPVDNSGRMPGGEEFASYAEFKDILVKHYLIGTVRGLMKNFALYGTGRKPDVADLEEIDAIMIKWKDRAYPLRDMLKALMRSKVFLDR